MTAAIRARGLTKGDEGYPGRRPPPDFDDPGRTAAELSSPLRAAPADEARLAAVERLTELRAAGSISEETFARERRRPCARGSSSV